MIKSIHIQNFKSLKDILMIPTSLNLLMGLNGMGKSSFIQSLLLLRQNKKSGLAKFALNGSLTEERACENIRRLVLKTKVNKVVNRWFLQRLEHHLYEPDSSLRNDSYYISAVKRYSYTHLPRTFAVHLIRAIYR